MSQRKQTYTPEQLITKLRDMDSQVIHGSDFFSQCAEQLTASRALNQKLEKRVLKLEQALSKIGFYCAGEMQLSESQCKAVSDNTLAALSNE